MGESSSSDSESRDESPPPAPIPSPPQEQAANIRGGGGGGVGGGGDGDDNTQLTEAAADGQPRTSDNSGSSQGQRKRVRSTQGGGRMSPVPPQGSSLMSGQPTNREYPIQQQIDNLTLNDTTTYVGNIGGNDNNNNRSGASNEEQQEQQEENVSVGASNEEQQEQQDGASNEEHPEEEEPSDGASNEEQQEQQKAVSKQLMTILQQLGIVYDSSLHVFKDNDLLMQHVSDAVETLMKICEEAPNNGRNFCWATTKASYLKNGRVLVLGHFPPNGQNLHLRGVLSAIISIFKDGTNTREDEASNSIPTNQTTYIFFKSVVKMMQLQYGITLDDAVMLCMQIFAWVDILPIDGHHSMGDKFVGSGNDRKENSFHQGYIDLRRLTDDHAAKYISEILELMPDIKAVIILGSAAWKFVQENPGLIPEELIIQHGPIVHPCVHATFGFTDRQAYEFCDGISSVLAHILGNESASIIVPDMEHFRRLCLFNPNKNHEGEFVYIGRYENKIVFIGHNRSHMEKLVSDPDIGVGFSIFPKQDDIRKGKSFNEVAGLTLELVHFLKHLRDCDLKPVWGIQNTVAHSAWKTSIIKKREEKRKAMEAKFGNEADALMMELGGS